MSRHLCQNLVVAKQWDGDELAEQTSICGLDHIPRKLEFERLRRPELKSDHQSLATDLLQELETLDHSRQAGHQTRACTLRVCYHAPCCEKFERYNPRRHGKVIFAERRSVHDCAIHAVENALEYALAHEQCPYRDVTTRKRLRDQHHIRLNAVVLDR